MNRFTILNRLRIWQKLALVALAFTIPLALTTFFLLEEKRIKIDFATWELYGTDYLRPSARLLMALGEHRSLQRLGTDGAATQRRTDAAGRVDRALHELDAVDRRLGAALATGADHLAARGRTRSTPAALRGAWERIRATAPGAAEIDGFYVTLSADVRALVTHVGDSSKLILDPDLDTYYTMDALLLRSPDVATRTFDLEQAARLAASRAELGLAERTGLAGQLDLLASHVEALSLDGQTAINEAPNFSRYTGLAAAIRGPLDEVVSAHHELRTLVLDGLVTAPAPLADAAQIAAAAARLSGATSRAWHVLMDEQDKMLDIRKNGDLERQRTALFSVLGALLVTLLLTALILRSITVPLRKAAGVAEQLARGELPDKVDVGAATDETGALLRAINDMLQFLDLRRTMEMLQDSARMLTRVTEDLQRQAGEQEQATARQAAALQETQVTAQEISHTSRLTADKASAVLAVAERAENVSRSGESAIGKTVGGLTDIRKQAQEIASTMGELEEQARQIGIITMAVKDLADQSNMLALNAAIEAVRSGEHGKGFSVVAREIRSLADQSIQATARVNDILEQIASSIRRAVKMAELGRDRIESGLSEVKSSGDSLQQLSSIVRESSQSARQIAAAVSQQDAGISQVFTAVTEQSRLMEETQKRVQETQALIGTVREAAGNVAEVVGRFRTERG